MRRWLKSHVMPSGTRERRILLGPAAGLRMDLDPARELRFWLGVYEAELAKHFRQMVQPSMRCFDIGGAEGYHALLLARLSEMPVVVFEPGEEWTEKIYAAPWRETDCRVRSNRFLSARRKTETSRRSTRWRKNTSSPISSKWISRARRSMRWQGPRNTGGAATAHDRRGPWIRGRTAVPRYTGTLRIRASNRQSS